MAKTLNNRFPTKCTACGATFVIVYGEVGEDIGHSIINSPVSVAAFNAHNCPAFAKIKAEASKLAPDRLATRTAARYLSFKRTTHNPHGTNHQCGAACRNAKGDACECECGGMNHGMG